MKAAAARDAKVAAKKLRKSKKREKEPDAAADEDEDRVALKLQPSMQYLRVN